MGGERMAGEQSRIYLDHNATSPLRPESREEMVAALDHRFANPSSLHEEGRAARALVEIARERVAALVSVSKKEVVFTSGGSEAISAAVRGVCDRAPAGLRRIVVGCTEHSAVLEAARLAERQGFETVRVGCDRDGRIDSAEFLRAVDRGTALAALQWANNETGVVQPVDEVGRGCRANGVAFLVDAVQAAGKVTLDPQRAYADLMAISSHKLGGPPGTGALLVREGIALSPLVCGGAQEMRRRGGTEALAAIAGFGAAARAALARLPRETERLLRMRAKLETRLRRRYSEIRFHGQAAPRLPNTVNFALPGISGETLAIALDLAGVAVSTGSACASGAVEPSHVIRAMGYDEAEARGAVRLSLGWNTAAEEVDRFLELLPRVVEQVRLGDPALR
jgi:cysteine desulfurase